MRMMRPIRSIGRILVIDDEPRLRELVAEFLRGEGFQVDTAGTGADGLRMIEQDRPALILLDVHLPDMTGKELALELQERGIFPPIVVMTAARDASDWAREIGAVSYIAKPLSLPSLLRRLNDLSA
jgi:two-component system, OmpR family, response regulator